MTDLTELGKIKQALNNKVDRDFYNNNKEAFNRELADSLTIKQSQSNYTGQNKSEIKAETGWLYYDKENDTLEIKREDGEWREVGGATSELKGRIDVIHCKETTVTDASKPLEIELEESYSASVDNLQVFVDGKIIESGFLSISDNGLKVIVDPKALVQDAQVKLQYFNFVPRSAIRAGIQTLGQICDTTVSNHLESGSVYADGYVYERTINGDFKYPLIDEEDESKWIQTDDFSEELYTKLRFANRNEFDAETNPEYETLLNDDRSNYIDAISFENWNFTGNEVYFALDPARHRYIVPLINSEIASTKKCVVVKSIYNDLMVIGKSLLSMSTTHERNSYQINSYLDSSANAIIENSSCVQFKKVDENFVLLGPTRLFYPNGLLGDKQQFTETLISTRETAYFTLSANSLVDGDYYVILNKIGNNTTSYTAKYIKPDQFYLVTPETETDTGAYLYLDNSKVEVFENGIKDDNFYSLPVCKISVLEQKITHITNCENRYTINNGLIISPSITVNIPLGFGDKFNRRNTICQLDTPQFVEITENTECVYLELLNDYLIAKSSDNQFIYDYNTNESSINNLVINGCEIWNAKDKTVGQTYSIQEKLYFDTNPIEHSSNIVSSGVVYSSLQNKADTYLENTGFISNGIVIIPEIGIGSFEQNKYTLNEGVKFLIASGLNTETGRLNSEEYTTNKYFELELKENINNGFIFFDKENEILFVSPKYLKQDTTPTDCVVDTIWYSSDNEIKRWNGTTWEVAKVVEVANHVNTDDNGNIISLTNCKVLTSGEGRVYQAGNGVNISDDGVISVTQLEWGNIDGDIRNQKDLQNALDSVIVRLKLISPSSSAEEIKDIYEVDLVEGDYIFCTVDDKFYKFNGTENIETDDYSLESSKLYLSDYDQVLYSWSGLDMISHQPMTINEVVEVKFSKGDQDIVLPSPCKSPSQLIIVSVGQVVLDPEDYTLSGNNKVILEFPAINDGYLRYLSDDYTVPNIINNFTKYVGYTVSKESDTVKIPLGAACSNANSIITSVNGSKILSKDNIQLEDKNTTLVLTDSSGFKINDKIDIWFGVVFGQTIAQSDWNETDEQSSSFIRNKPEISTNKRLNLFGNIIDNRFVCSPDELISLKTDNSYELHIISDINEIPDNLPVVIKINSTEYNLNNILQMDPNNTTTVEQLAQVKSIDKYEWLFNTKYVETDTNKYFVTSGSIINQEAILPKIDNNTITVNDSKQLQVQSIKADDTTLRFSRPMTLSEYESIEEKDPNTIYNITDDYTGNGVLDEDLSNISEKGLDSLRLHSSPSNKYEDLPLGASGTKYLAPADGWFAIDLVLYGSGYVEISTDLYGVKNFAPNDNNVKMMVQVSRDNEIELTYSGFEGTLNYFRFIYKH